VTKKSRPYEDRTDLEKIRSQWKKLSGLHTREEWSAAIVRAATAAEIAANFAVRQEFTASSSFDEDFVDGLLIWSNGLAGKLDRLLIPVTALDGAKNKEIRALKTIAREINRKRNSVVHQGEFCNEEEAESGIASSREFITRLIQIYEPAFALKDKQA